MAEAGRQRDDEAHMGGGQLMKGRLVALVLPAHGKQVLLFAFEKGRIHGRADEPAANP